MHHIALDGFGTTLLFQRIAELYAEGLAGEMNSPSPFGSLAEVLAEEASREQSGKNAAARAFWQEQLQGWPEVKSFSEARAPIAAEFIRESRPLPAVLWQSLTGFADEHKLGWPDLLLAGLSAQLSLSSGQEKTLFGLMMMNRIGSASLTVPCMQMNITPLALALDEGLSLVVAADAVAKAKRGVRKHQHYRYELLRRDLGLVGGDKRLFGPLVNIMPFDHARRFGPLSPIFSTSAPARWKIHHRGAGWRRWPAQTGSGRQPGLLPAGRSGGHRRYPVRLAGSLAGRAYPDPGALKADWLAEQRASALIAGPAHEVIKTRPVLEALCHFAAQTPDKIALIQSTEQERPASATRRCWPDLNRWQPPCRPPVFSRETGSVSCWRAAPGHLRPAGGAAGGRSLRAARSRAAAGAPGPYSAAGEVKTLITQAEYRHKLASLFEGRTLLVGDLLAGIW